MSSLYYWPMLTVIYVTLRPWTWNALHSCRHDDEWHSCWLSGHFFQLNALQLYFSLDGWQTGQIQFLCRSAFVHSATHRFIDSNHFMSERIRHRRLQVRNVRIDRCDYAVGRSSTTLSSEVLQHWCAYRMPREITSKKRWKYNQFVKMSRIS